MQDIVKFGISIVLVVTIATLFVLSIQYWPADKQIQTLQPNQVRLHPTFPRSPIVIVKVDFATPNFDLSTMKKMASLVILGRVVKQTQGQSINLAENDKIPQISNTIQIERVLKGNYKGDTVQVLTPGSMSNRILVEDTYKLKNGERAIFMLFKWKNGYEVVGLNQGKYQIEGDDMVRGKFVKGMDIDNFRMQVLDVDRNTILKEHQVQPLKQQEQEQTHQDNNTSDKQPQKHLSDSQQKTFDKIMKQREQLQQEHINKRGLKND